MLRLYSRKLGAVLLPVDASLCMTDAVHEAFFEQCELMPEFHFLSAREQVARARKAHAQNPLKPGDFFITRHSNLCDVHLVFHVVLDRKDNYVDNSSKASSTTLQGLWSALALASQYDVTSLALPVPLAVPEDAFPMTTQESAYIKIVDTLIRNLRSFLGANVPDTIKTFSLVFPYDLSPTITKKVRSWITS
eukprot:m51a1_g5502 hypothetical protein (192) ;mRNA; r:365144-365830